MRAYFFSITLLLSLILGGCSGYFFGDFTVLIKPFGDLFLNLIFTTIVPLIFFSVALAMARIGSWQRFRYLIVKILSVFFGMGLLAAILAYFFLQILAFNPSSIKLLINSHLPHASIYHGWHEIFTVSQFFELLSHQHILALIIFSGLIGMAVSQSQGQAISFLEEGEKIFMLVFRSIMWLAPLGFFAYFANVVHDLGPQIVQEYGKITLAYYAFASLYFVFGFSGLIYFFAGQAALRKYWQVMILPASTALATCSSAATIPANLLACVEMKLKPSLYETVIPFGTMIHKQGSIIGGVFKIAFIYSMFHLDFHGLMAMSSAVMISILVGTVMGAIPSGGMLGELLILSIYGFPNSALIAMAAISILIDPIATVLNACGNLVATVIMDQQVATKD